MSLKSFPTDLTPSQIVAELDKYIIGQDAAKRAVAIALRNRWRRAQVEEKLREEILPKNIIMVGPTGVGKTEIARRMARLTGAPFIKVEASKFTEVGYVGRDVESIIRDLTEAAVNLVQKESIELVRDKARQAAEDQILEILVPSENPRDGEEGGQSTREKFREKLRNGELDETTVEVDVTDKPQGGPMMEIFPMGMEGMDFNMKDMLSGFMPKRTRPRKMTVPEALEILQGEEAEKMVDMDEVTRVAIHNTEQNGIVFLDEIDKVAGRSNSSGPDVSREGVQRDLLPIVEGSNVSTKYGMVRTDHILFIAAGAFHVAKPSDLIPELQGRFPIRVELNSLSKEDFVRILTEPKNALITQYVELLKTEKVTLDFSAEAIAELAKIASEVNAQDENIGARRLHTIMEKTLEDVSFEAPTLSGQTITVTPEYINKQLGDILKDQDLTRYIL